MKKIKMTTFIVENQINYEANSKAKQTFHHQILLVFWLDIYVIAFLVAVYKFFWLKALAFL